MAKDFVSWLTEELNHRGWSNSELARRSGMAHSTISMVISGQNKPGWDFCAGVARAFGKPPEWVFRVARLLPPLPVSQDEPTLQELLEFIRQLPIEDRLEVLNYAEYRYQQRQKPQGSTEVVWGLIKELEKQMAALDREDRATILDQAAQESYLAGIFQKKPGSQQPK